MAEIVLDGVSKRFADGFEAVKHMDLDVADGEFMILVGPSGCGKSTALRMIAGLEDITEGELRIGDQVVNGQAPKERDIAMVFQNYALYPHMTVRENMAFPLKLAGVSDEETNSKVEEAARVLDLEQHLDRKPANLSGGQRQRVAMGRAIVRDPKAFLMDEPLSNLDAKLRVQTRTEVARLQSQLGTTTVYVTHDQIEAMTLGDRVAVMRSGVLQQVASPTELYDNPTNLFVAGFIGSPAMNFMPGHVEGGKVKLPIGDLDLPEGISAEEGQHVIAGIRPESFEDAALLGEDARGRGTTFKAKIDLVEALGSEKYAHFQVETERLDSQELAELAADAGTDEVPGSGEGQIVARVESASKVQRGQEAELWVDTSKLQLFDPSDGRSLRKSSRPAVPPVNGGSSDLPAAQDQAQQPAPEQPAPEQPSAEQPAPEQPSAEQPAPEQPSAEQPPASSAEQPPASSAEQPPASSREQPRRTEQPPPSG
jgi:multiple sugar transport system ATP-binding protein